MGIYNDEGRSISWQLSFIKLIIDRGYIHLRVDILTSRYNKTGIQVKYPTMKWLYQLTITGSPGKNRIAGGFSFSHRYRSGGSPPSPKSLKGRRNPHYRATFLNVVLPGLIMVVLHRWLKATGYAIQSLSGFCWFMTNPWFFFTCVYPDWCNRNFWRDNIHNVEFYSLRILWCKSKTNYWSDITGLWAVKTFLWMNRGIMWNGWRNKASRNMSSSSTSRIVSFLRFILSIFHISFFKYGQRYRKGTTCSF